jgi:hypothetical protein
MSIREVLDEIREKDGQDVSSDHLFREWLNYEGIIGYDREIKTAIKIIYGIDLEKVQH